MGAVEAAPAARLTRVNEPKSALRNWTFWVGLVIGAICVWLVARRVDWPLLKSTIASLNPAWLLAGAAASAGATSISALRWRQLASHQTPLSYRDAFESLTIGNFTNLVLPSRGGDLLRAILVARDAQSRVSPVLASIVVERYADVLMLLVFALALSTVVAFPAPVRAALLMLAAVLFGSLAVIYVLGERSVGLAIRIVRLVLPRFAESIGRRITGFWNGLTAAGGWHTMAVTIALSMGSWLLWGLASVLILEAFDFSVPWYAGLFVMVVVNLGGLVPASPGSIGIYHYLAVLGLSVWISNTSVALGFAVVSHAFAILITTIFGSWSLTRRGLTLGAAAHTTEAWTTQPNH